MTFPELEKDRPDPMAYGRAIPHGFGVNLVVRDVIAAARFQAEVLGAAIRYWERHFAIMHLHGHTWFLHSDWSYRDHPMTSAFTGLETRGGGVELRLYGVDPDQAEARARELGALVLAAALDKPHGVREAYLVDPDGYVWVPTVPLPA